MIYNSRFKISTDYSGRDGNRDTSSGRDGGMLRFMSIFQEFLTILFPALFPSPLTRQAIMQEHNNSSRAAADAAKVCNSKVAKTVALVSSIWSFHAVLALVLSVLYLQVIVFLSCKAFWVFYTSSIITITFHFRDEIKEVLGRFHNHHECAAYMGSKNILDN